MNAPYVVVIYPAQCRCGHVYIEKYEWQEPLPDGSVGFCWCGWCRTRRNVFPVTLPESVETAQ